MIRQFTIRGDERAREHCRLNAFTGTPVLMAAKAHLRNQRPLLIAISTNDGLAANAKNLGMLLNAKNVYLVPFGQDNPEEKPNSLVADMRLLVDAAVEALRGRQLQPLLIQYRTISWEGESEAINERS